MVIMILVFGFIFGATMQLDISVILTPQIGHIDPPWVFSSKNSKT